MLQAAVVALEKKDRESYNRLVAHELLASNGPLKNELSRLVGDAVPAAVGERAPGSKPWRQGKMPFRPR